MRERWNALRGGTAALLVCVGSAAALWPAPARAAAPLTVAQVRAACATSGAEDEENEVFIQTLLPTLAEKTDADLRAGVSELSRAPSDPMSDLILCMVKQALALRTAQAPVVAGGGRDAPAPAGAGTKGKSVQLHVQEAEATDCLAPLEGGGVRNTCDFAIEYIYCVYRPKKDSWSSLFDCEQGKNGSWQVGPLSTAIMQNQGERLVYFGCRYGPTLAKPDGISPADFRFVTPDNSVARCKRW